MKPAREWTEAELLSALRADMQRPFREVRRTHLRKLREQAEGVAEAVEATAQRRRRKKAKHWTEKQPGQLRAIRAEIQGGNVRRLSAPARQALSDIAGRPEVTRSRKFTSAKVARIVVDTDLSRRLFHRWSARVARDSLTRKGTYRLQELERQEQATYESMEAALLADELEDVPDGPWFALDDAEPNLRVLEGGRASE
jgi:hypothetical protein